MRTKISKLDLIKKLHAVHDETSIEFPFQIRAILSKNIENKDNYLLKLFEEIYKEDLNDKSLRFKAFYAHLVTLWRLKEFEDYRNRIDIFENTFSSYHMFSTFRAQYYSSQGYKIDNLFLAVEYSKKALENLKNSPNVHYLFADLTAQLGEVNNNLDLKTLKDAEINISKSIAITQGKYAKYFAAQARISSLLGDFSKARESIEKAIEKEPSTNPEYSLRISEYLSIKSKIDYRENYALMEKKQQESLKLFEGLKLEVIQLLGLLSAIISFLVTSVQISKGFKFTEAYKLIVISGLTTVVIFTCFSLIFSNSKIKPLHAILLIASFLSVVLLINTESIIFYFKLIIKYLLR